MTQNTTPGKGSGRWWILAVPLLLLPVVVLYGIFFYKVNHDPSFGVEPDYYVKGVQWDEHQAQARENLELGWRLELALLPAQPGIMALTLQLADSTGLVIDDARISVVAFANARSAQRMQQDFVASDSGYRALLPMDQAGIWEFRITATRGESVYTETLRRELDAALLDIQGATP
ncbi:MAG: FixH family protein [Calditrichaeota bacterium]|nr:FixH family protein [Candidatus Cloacimonadota bacterium]MCB1045707.1 FixH family protein [Calditrichota bacterium]MCB9473596.1 FixH family protein [Candidatus Delongbacteria bacterium]